MKALGFLSSDSRPWGLSWRASSWTITAVVALGIAVDLLVYSIIIPVMPFHLEEMGYSQASAMTGWLLFAYSGGLVGSTIPIAMLSERYQMRRSPLLLGLVILLASQIILMEAPNYAVMCVARVLQGIGSSMVWVVGLALLCDTSPPSIIGLQLGIAMSGVSVGMAIGPPVGGLIYNRFGFRGPIIFGLIATFVDLVGRLLIVERKDALKWGVDPMVIGKSKSDEEKSAKESPVESEQGNKETRDDQSSPTDDSSSKPVENLSLIRVISLLGKSPRALVACGIIFSYGVIFTGQEPSIPLHLEHVWGLGPGTVGLVFLAGVVPTFVSSPLAGWLTDRYGPEWITIGCLLLSLPWWVVITIEKALALFIVSFGVEVFFTSGVMAPVTAELAAVSKGIPGIGYGHMYGAFNLAYGVGNTIGPVIGGQIYENVGRGWLVLCLMSVGILSLCALVAAFCIGERPLSTRFRSTPNLKSEKDTTENQNIAS